MGIQELYKTLGDANCLTRKSKKTMSAICKKYADLEKVENASLFLQKNDVLQGTTYNNVTNISKNTGRNDVLVEKSDQFNEQASICRTWKDPKMSLILGGLLIVIVLI